MRRVLTIALLACFTPLAAARAEEPSAATYPIDTWRTVWKVGDAATTRNESSFSISSHSEFIKNGETIVRDHEASQTETLLYVAKCLAVDDKGRRTKFVVHFFEWSLVENDGEPDESLKGTHVEVTITDGTRAWKLLTPDAKPSGRATGWLDKRYGKDKQSGGDLDRMGRPAAPIKVGDSWKGDPLALDLPFPLKKDTSSMDLKLVSVDDGVFRIGVKFSLEFDGLPIRGTEITLPFTEGGAFTGEGEIRDSLAPHRYVGGSVFKGKLQGTASRKGLATVMMGLEVVYDSATTQGGDMPPVPAPKPAEPAGAPK